MAEVPVPSEVLPAGVSGLWVAVDTETSGLFVDDGATLTVVSVCWRDGTDLFSYAFPFDQGKESDEPGYGPNLPDTEWFHLLHWLGGQQLIFHHAKFDLHHLTNGTRWWHGKDFLNRFVWDTKLAQDVLDPTESSSLKPTAERLLEAGAADEQQAVLDWLSKQGAGLKKRYDRIPWDLIGPYADQDARLTFRLFELQHRRLAAGEDHHYKHIIREFDFSRVLYRMEQRGIGFNQARCTLSAQILQQRKQDIEDFLPFRPTVPAAKKYFFGPKPDGLGLIPTKLTAKDQPALDDQVINQLVAKGVPVAAEYQRWNNMKSALEKWYGNWPNLVGPDGRIRCSYRQGGARTGRLSVERVQLQAIPHDYQLSAFFGDGVEGVRAFFEAKPDHEIWEIDISQAEIRVATSIASCTPMRERLEAGEDAHDATTRLVFQIDKDHPDWDKMRSIGKRLTFGMLYGAGVRTVRDQIRLHTGIDAPEHQVKEWVSSYRAAFPEFVAAARLADRVVQSRGYLRLISGRHRYWGFDEQSHKAFNAVIQGGVAEAMKDVMIDLEERLPGILLLQIHDSLVLEVPADGAERVVDEAKKILTSTFEALFKIGFRADAKRWDK